MTNVLSPRALLITSREDAAREMLRIGVCKGGVDAMEGKARTLVIKVTDASVPTAHVLKQQMLSLGGDAAVAKDVITHGVDSTDVLIMGTPRQVRELVSRLSWQPFGLPELGDRISSLLDALDGPGASVLRAGPHTLDLAERVHVMGILNVTPDSFSDGGEFLRPTAAAEHARRMIDEGADIIDVGGQSSRPGSQPVSEDDELERVVPVIRKVREQWDGPVSVDTYRARVAEEALAAGATMVNDITAFSAEPRIAEVTARAGAAAVLMHMRGTPATMQQDTAYDDLMGELAFFLGAAVDRALEAGVGGDQIAIDPGIGFGKTTEHNLAILRHLPELAVLGRPILVGPSRKSFIGNVLDLPVEERLEGTLATVAYAVVQGARILRVHDVRPTVRVARMVEACISAPE
ncbi:MAG TPA: dihydropteroate synthase [bacterium]|nr:dihydropteroate synthase [bacterium]